MPITPFLAGQAFDPETIEVMSAAFVAACDALHLKVGDDPATRLVAEKVINLAQRGIRDSDALRTMTLREFNLSDEGARDNYATSTQPNTMTLRIVIALSPSGPTTFLERRYSSAVPESDC